jgi:hypothetical protein
MMQGIDYIRVAGDLIVLEKSVPLARRYLWVRRRDAILRLRSLDEPADRLERLRQRMNRTVILLRFLEAELKAVVLTL